MVEVVHPNLLEAAGENIFRLPDLDELGYTFDDVIQNPEQIKVLQGKALEQSNVNLAEQMSELILTQRSYQFNSRTISMGDLSINCVHKKLKWSDIWGR
ncbi:flagellar basal body rod C-terminal domain-containing protein [Oceanobacillus senegalensis]|uniref:flagellar basal body rod C-terminal domain-containing protein n=1 Tax=Oceanobacillus senegalensis TaxID=1936063 RepID=UPI001FE8AA59|nr:flagellar basal body rod C-terminal domain-containing protein [Oceanobacillus senegalensis]